jgi:predicted transcriptional regulator
MAFKTTDLPQADKLERVILTVEAVSKGNISYSGIANYIGFTDRQGRYYRHAAELLGFITNFNNNAEITEFGKDLINSDESEEKHILQQAILDNSLFKAILNQIEKFEEGMSKNEIEEFLFNITIDPSKATISRRLSTLLQWLVDKKIGLINKVGTKYIYNPIIIVNDEDTEIEDSYRRENSSVGSIYPTDDYTTELDIREEHITIFGLIRRIQQGKVLMNPEFQRNFVWTKIQQSRFIESLILNIPLPPLYVSQDGIGNYIIIDGLQRSTTLLNFIDKKFELQGLQAIPSLNGLTYDRLPQDLQIRIEDKNLLIYILRPTVPMVVVYDIFNRINTGGTQLTRQEIRNCIYIGNATELLRELSELSEFKNATDYGISPSRMKDREAVLRFLAFYILDYKEHYKNDMDEFLGKAMKKINTLENSEIENLKEVFKKTMKTAFELFGFVNFRLPIKYSRGRINIAIMESVSVFISKSNNQFLIDNKSKLYDNYLELISNDSYLDSVRSSTATTSKVITRFEIATQILGKI